MASMSSDRLACTPRLLATAVGVAITGMSAAQLAQADQTEPLSLGTTTVTGDAVEGDYKVEQAQSSKYTAPLRDTPRSVTVVPQQVLKDTNSLNLQDALRTVPGITMGAGEGGNPTGDRPFIRGFDSQSSMYLDGVRDTGAQTRELFAVEAVEVVKGSDSAMGGRNSAGGSINLVSKKAHLGNSLDGGFTWGSDQTQRYTLDGNYQFNETTAGRLNLMSHENNVAGRDAVNNDRWGLAASLAFGLGTPTRVFLDYYHMENDDLPDSGIPYSLNTGSSGTRTSANPDKPTDGGDSSNFYGLKGRDFSKGRADISTIAVEHDLSDNLTVKNTLRHGSSMQDYIWSQPDDSKGNILNDQVFRRANQRVSNTTSTVNQTELFGETVIAGFKNNFSFGVELGRENVDRSGYTLPGTSAGTCTPALVASGDCTSLSNPNPNQAYTGTITRNYYGTDTDADTRALWAFDTLELTQQWLLNMGLRYDYFDTSAKTSAATGVTKIEDTSEFITGQLGLVYKPVENGSIYVSYATSATPPGSTLGEGAEPNGLNDGNGTSGSIRSDMEPEETTNYEIGTKWDLLDNRLSLGAAVFRTEKDNARVLTSNFTYENVGKTRVDGYELTATGRLTRKWNVFAGYSYLDSELVEGGAVGNRAGAVTSAVNPDNGNQLANTPNHAFSLWTTYDVTDKLAVGGGAFYVDEVYGNTANTLMVDSYWRYDAMASYKVNKHLDFQINVQNLTDETYYDKAYGAHYANQAAGRTALLSTNFHF
ncbi:MULTISPECIES: TonB-dependent siderophore receptor [unclassified Pseudomonas]|uniref:TonB-dependent receptor n=1 Tax=unclassified Pseudomonas TaxID=196821 RepID=UPI001C58DC93